MEEFKKIFKRDFSEKEYCVFGNFGMIRFGDLVGIASLVKFLKLYNSDLKIGISDECIYDGIKDYKKYFLDLDNCDNRTYSSLPLNGNIWSYYYYIHKIAKKNNIDLNLKMDLKKIVSEEEYIVINPMFDSEYDINRKWDMKYFKYIYDNCKIMGLPIYVICPTEKDKKNIEQLGVTGNIYSYEQSMSLIYFSTYYIGGNTGLTHLAAHSPYIKKFLELSKKQHIVDKNLTMNKDDKKLFDENIISDESFKIKTRCMGTNKNYINSDEILCDKNNLIFRFFGKDNKMEKCVVCGNDEYIVNPNCTDYKYCTNCETLSVVEIKSNGFDPYCGEWDRTFLNKLLNDEKPIYKNLMDDISKNEYGKMFVNKKFKSLYAFGGGFPKIEALLNLEKILVYDICADTYTPHLDIFKSVYNLNIDIDYKKYLIDADSDIYKDCLEEIEETEESLISFVHFLEHLNGNLFDNLMKNLLKFKKNKSNKTFFIYQPEMTLKTPRSGCHWHDDHLMFIPYKTFVPYLKKLGFEIKFSRVWGGDLVIIFE